MATTNDTTAKRIREFPETYIEEETLSDGSKVYNLHIPAVVLFCTTEKDALLASLEADDFISDLIVTRAAGHE